MTKTPFPQIVLVRHGETEWSSSGRHTSVTDIPLTPKGEAAARRLGDELRGWDFEMVLSSPLMRARQTCDLAGLGGKVEVSDDLFEFRYGEYEGLTNAQIGERHPGWVVFQDGCPGGESPEQVAARADRLVERFRQTHCDVIAFSHGHFIRALAVRWIGLEVAYAARFALTTAAVCILGFDHDRTQPVIRLWNDDDFRRTQGAGV